MLNFVNTPYSLHRRYHNVTSGCPQGTDECGNCVGATPEPCASKLPHSHMNCTTKICECNPGYRKDVNGNCVRLKFLDFLFLLLAGKIKK